MKPVILIGNGVRGNPALVEHLCSLNIPILTTWQGADLVPEDSPVFCGRPGVIGQRAANIIQQKATHFYSFGARLDNEQVAHNYYGFAPQALKFIWDVDSAERNKFPSDWLTNEFEYTDLVEKDTDLDWLSWCKALYNRFRPELDGTDTVEDYVDPYYFVRILSDACGEGEVIVPGSSGMQSCAMLQAFKVKRGQRLLCCNTIGAMGLEPMAIGAALAADKRVICVTGDGGFFLNFQELEVVKRLNLNIKYFVFCNGGYGSISTMQDARFNHRVGSDPGSGFTLPDLSYTAMVWNFEYHSLNDNADVRERLPLILNSPEASIVQVNTSLAFRYACKVQSAMKDGILIPDSMEDMSPKLPPAELAELMNA